MARPICTGHRLLALGVAAALAGCTGTTAGEPPAGDTSDPIVLETIPPVGARLSDHRPATPSSDEPAVAPAVAIIDERGVFAPVVDGTVSDTWSKFVARPAPDASTAVLTLSPDAVRGWGSTKLAWLSMPAGERLAELLIDGAALETTATSLDGSVVGLVTLADEPLPDAIAGARASSEIVIASAEGVLYEQTLDGNVVPEAFSRSASANGLPNQVFLLEYFPADAPRFYRVRVLSTATGEVSLPLNLRNKAEQVDERMAGFTRSQVVAHEQGLLFTLYRGTIDGRPDGEPYAFVHTLDFADGVWCLEVDPKLELDRVPGTLAVGGDRLYVASANGFVGAFEIPAITDPTRSPTMTWVRDVARPGTTAPPIAADVDGVWLGYADGASRLIRLDPAGNRGDPFALPGSAPTALTLDDGGRPVAVGPDWTMFGDVDRPGWLGAITGLAVARRPGPPDR